MFRTFDDQETGYRLKVLWIEDKAKVIDKAISVDGASISPYFKIWVAMEPYDIVEGLVSQKDEINKSIGSKDVYSNYILPFDGYLADYNLVSSGTHVDRRLYTDDDDSLREQIWDYENVAISSEEVATGEEDLRDQAKKAQAAGLTSAVLTALNFDAHPAVVIPYTGYVDQLSYQRALLVLLTPDSVIVEHGSELSLSKDPIGMKLKQFADSYRSHLPVWAEKGVLHVSDSERERIVKLAQERSDETGRVSWREDDTLVVVSNYGRRRVAMGSLWFHGKDDPPPTVQTVSAWADRFPVARPVFRQAKDLAFKYFKLGCSDRSIERYELSRLIRVLQSHRQAREKNDKKLSKRILSDIQEKEIRETIEAICSEIKVNPTVAIENPDTVAILDQGWAVPHMLSLPSMSEEVERLALHMVVLMAISGRHHRNREIIGEFQSGLKSMLDDLAKDSPPPTEDAKGFPITKIDLDPASLLGLALAMIDVHSLEISDDGKTYRIPEQPPLEAKHIVQLIDPLPDQLLTADVDFAAGRVGAKVRRMNINLADLLSGTGGYLSGADRRELRAFASEIWGFPMARWPDWLKRS